MPLHDLTTWRWIARIYRLRQKKWRVEWQNLCKETLLICNGQFGTYGLYLNSKLNSHFNPNRLNSRDTQILIGLDVFVQGEAPAVDVFYMDVI